MNKQTRRRRLRIAEQADDLRTYVPFRIQRKQQGGKTVVQIVDRNGAMFVTGPGITESRAKELIDRWNTRGAGHFMLHGDEMVWFQPSIERAQTFTLADYAKMYGQVQGV